MELLTTTAAWAPRTLCSLSLSLFDILLFSTPADCLSAVSEPWNCACLDSSTDEINLFVPVRRRCMRRLSLWYHPNTVWLGPRQWDSWMSVGAQGCMLGVSFTLLSHSSWTMQIMTSYWKDGVVVQRRWGDYLQRLHQHSLAAWVPCGSWLLGVRFRDTVISQFQLLQTVNATEEVLAMFFLCPPYMFMCVHVCVPFIILVLFCIYPWIGVWGKSLTLNIE